MKLFLIIFLIYSISTISNQSYAGKNSDRKWIKNKNITITNANTNTVDNTKNESGDPDKEKNQNGSRGSSTIGEKNKNSGFTTNSGPSPEEIEDLQK